MFGSSSTRLLSTIAMASITVTLAGLSAGCEGPISKAPRFGGVATLSASTSDFGSDVGKQSGATEATFDSKDGRTAHSDARVLASPGVSRRPLR